MSPGAKLIAALKAEKPLQMVGVCNAYSALQAQSVGFRALYLSGSATAAGAFGLPDLGMTSLDNVLTELKRITDVSALPVLVDADTGWGGELNVARTVKQMEQAGAAGLHLEDQLSPKRCGHRPGKVLVSTAEMQARVMAAVDAKQDKDFVIMARTDALGVEGLEAAISRAQAYVAVGAQMIFAEGVTELAQLQAFCQQLKVPVLANMTEFGVTPQWSLADLKQAGASIALYPLSAFRAMNKAALAVFSALRKEGDQKSVLGLMQTREELYKMLNYQAYEQLVDKYIAEEFKNG